MCMAYTVILLWLVSARCSKTGSSVEEEHVECRHQRITDAVVVDIHLIRKYFTCDAWLSVEQVLKKKQAEVNDLDF